VDSSLSSLGVCSSHHGNYILQTILIALSN
jgi:hypothetical protein